MERTAGPVDPVPAYAVLEILAPPEAEETVVTALAACDTVGAWTPHPGLVRGYFRRPAPDLARRFAEAWRAVAGTPLAYPTAQRTVPGEDWLARWRESVRAVPVAPGLWIAPPASPPPAPHEAVVWIEPGQGFGTGSHPTTRALLRRLAEAPPAGPVLDVGTGSGILALAALRLGAPRAVGLDLDAAAIGNAASNRRLNPDGRRLALVQGTLDALAPERRFAVVLANLDASGLTRSATALAGRVAPGGRLGVAGLLDGEEAPVVGLLGAAGLTLLDAAVAPDPSGSGAWWSGWFGRGSAAARREGSRR